MSQPIQPQPTPVGFSLAKMQNSNGELIAAVKFHLVTGETVIFLAPDVLRRLGQQFMDTADEMSNAPTIIAPRTSGLVGLDGMPISGSVENLRGRRPE